MKKLPELELERRQAGEDKFKDVRTYLKFRI